MNNMSKKQLVFAVIIASLLGGIITLGGYKLFIDEPAYKSIKQEQPVQFSNYYEKVDTAGAVVPEGLNFIKASKIVRPAVVHVKTYYKQQSSSSRKMHPFFDEFFDEEYKEEYRRKMPKRSSAGSGVIIDPNGYIATNHHVIKDASKIEIMLDNKKKFDAKVVGKDPETDLALLKINARGLPCIKYGNSESVQVGEWVLAAGNPFELNSTITAGIVSAKARNISILSRKNRFAIESFIQTDAAVNPGNSGGALVNLKGELIGINTAIASPSGTYAGYSFAVPSTLVKKVMTDLKKHGEVQRAILGVTIRDMNTKLAEDEGIEELQGVYVDSVMRNSAASEAGIKSGDVITHVDDHRVKSSPELQEAIALHRPGDEVSITLKRDGQEMDVQATLKNKEGTYKLVKSSKEKIEEKLNAKLEPVEPALKEKLDLSFGVQVKNLKNGKLKNAGIREGFIITHIDKKPVRDLHDMAKIMDKRSGGVLIEGVYPDGSEGYYAIGFSG